MKKIILLVTIAIIAFSCQKETKKEAYTLNIDATGYATENIYLNKLDSLGKVVVLDTVAIANEKATFTGVTDEKDVYFIRIDGENMQVPFILDNEEITIVLNKEEIATSEIKDVTGTTNKGYNEYRAATKDFDVKIKALNEQGKVAVQSQDTATYNRLGKEFQQLRDQQIEVEKEFIKTHLDDISGLLILDKNYRYKTIPENEVLELYNQLSEEVRNSNPARNLKKSFEILTSTKIGAKAPNFSGPTPDGGTVSLNNITKNAKVTIVDFWASWCKPCRMENPNIVKLYNQYKDQGLTIVGVSLDKDGKRWRDAIAQDQLTWNHVSSLLYWNEPIAKQYGITSIPQMYVLDSNGVIIAKNLRGQELDDKLAELF